MIACCQQGYTYAHALRLQVEMVKYKDEDGDLVTLECQDDLEFMVESFESSAKVCFTQYTVFAPCS